jgi:hypothetical protein
MLQVQFPHFRNFHPKPLRVINPASGWGHKRAVEAPPNELILGGTANENSTSGAGRKRTDAVLALRSLVRPKAWREAQREPRNDQAMFCRIRLLAVKRGERSAARLLS